MDRLVDPGIINQVDTVPVGDKMNVMDKMNVIFFRGPKAR